MKLTIIIRDDGPMFHCGDSPKYRTVCFPLSAEQKKLITLSHTYSNEGKKYYEEISKVILEPIDATAKDAEAGA